MAKYEIPKNIEVLAGSRLYAYIETSSKERWIPGAQQPSFTASSTAEETVSYLGGLSQTFPGETTYGTLSLSIVETPLTTVDKEIKKLAEESANAKIILRTRGSKRFELPDNTDFTVTAAGVLGTTLKDGITGATARAITSSDYPDNIRPGSIIKLYDNQVVVVDEITFTSEALAGMEVKVVRADGKAITAATAPPSTAGKGKTYAGFFKQTFSGQLRPWSPNLDEPGQRFQIELRLDGAFPQKEILDPESVIWPDIT